MPLNRGAIQRTFNFLRRRKYNYQFALGSPAGQEVLKDLARFCRANSSTFHVDERTHALLEGRREVWLRIEQHLNMTPEQLLSIYNGGQFNVITGDDDD